MSLPDVLIVGGGVIGLSVAYRLSKDGLKVTVVERGQCGQEASWASAGVLTPCSWHRQDDLARMHMDAIFRYHEFVDDLQERSGIDPQFIRCGALKLILDVNRMKMAVNEVKVVGDRKTPEGKTIVSTLTPGEARLLETHLTEDIMGAQHCQMTAQVRNPRLMQALRVSCQRSGVDLRENVAVRALIKNGEQVAGVQTDQGRVSAGNIILCAGAWSAELDPVLSEHVPVYPVRGQIILLHMDEPAVNRVIQVVEEKFYIVVRNDGHILVGSTEEHETGFNKRNTAKGLARLSEMAIRFVPALVQATLVQSWADLRPGTPDRRPLIGFVPDLKNLIAATGHFRTGLVLAPVTADIVADLMHKGSCDYDLGKCAPGRNFPQ